MSFVIAQEEALRNELRRNLPQMELNQWCLHLLYRSWFMDDSGVYRINKANGKPDKRVKYTPEDLWKEWVRLTGIVHASSQVFTAKILPKINCILASRHTFEDQFSEAFNLRLEHNLSTLMPVGFNWAWKITNFVHPFELEETGDSDVRIALWVADRIKAVMG
ncbi:hypothetical protein CC2G_005018 [Coprinopsis cinerea AmutBmut pab1-1]|nr:hypothetical protein CC2G_005018 [Coprinopsis cinerea AmutBmut pab1-1]